MKTKTTLTDEEQVNAFISGLDPAVAEVVTLIRSAILSAGKTVAERIKWNNPSFYYTGEMKDFDPKEYKRDIAVFNLFKNRMMLVLPTGAGLKDETGLLEGNYTDGRRLIVFKDLADAKQKEKPLKKLIQQWLKQTDL